MGCHIEQTYALERIAKAHEEKNEILKDIKCQIEIANSKLELIAKTNVSVGSSISVGNMTR